MKKTVRITVMTLVVFFLFPILSTCDLFNVSLVDYLKDETGNGTPDEGTPDEGTPEPVEWVYLAVSTGNDSNSGWTEAEPVETFGKALAIWEAKCLAEGSDKAWIMLTEDIKVSLGYDEALTNTDTALVDFSTNPVIPSGITTITFAGSGTGITIDNAGFNGTTGRGRRVLSIKASGKTIILRNLTIKGGERATASGGSLYNGGGIYIGDHSRVIMEDDVIIENNTAGYRGGGVYVEGDGSIFTMKGGEIRNNKAKDIVAAATLEKGGGVYVGSNGTFIMEGGAIKGNESDIDGGGIYVEDTNATFTMKGGEISGNKALNPGSGKGGGGVCVGASGTFAMEGGTIKDNESGSDGGGVYVAGISATFTMKGGEIRENRASGSGLGKGGGVHVGASGTYTM
ncbi:MAG: right-handed parallel beta-helix repeat-containing protein, partial [Treponema sp.]|nr:right-handed parallel beta-helix repeat-containing protein [Treponema sp.]